jgi:hypothetical protein
VPAAVFAYFKEQAELLYSKSAAGMKKSSPGRFFKPITRRDFLRGHQA